MPTKNYRTDLLQRLGNSQYAATYLKAALDETLSDGDTEALASESNISRQHLYRILSGNGNPTLDTLTSVLQAVGLTIDFKPATIED